MDRQEQIQNLAKIARISVSYAEDLYDSFFPKPVVQQCVADWYEGNKEWFEYNLIECINSIPLGIDGEELTEFEKWLLERDSNPIQTLVDMHRLGYTVEKEDRYTVEIKGFDDDDTFLNYNTAWDFWFLDDDKRTEEVRVAHTRKELESNGFGWVFDCPGVEVKEVTDEQS